MADNVKITQGTQTDIATDDVSGVQFQKIKLDTGADGISSAFTGTLGAITNLAGGTLTRLEGGSVVVTAGTISDLDTVGTVGRLEGGSVVVTTGTTNVTTGSIVVTAGTMTTGTLTKNAYRPVNQATSFGTVGTAGGSLFGTISGTSGGGTVHLVSNVDIVQVTGTSEILVLYCSALTGGSVLAQGAFAPGGGISKTFNPPIESGTNSEIIYHFVGAGTSRITVSYWKTI